MNADGDMLRVASSIIREDGSRSGVGVYIPAKNAPDIDLPQARRLIDLLDLLADRTKGRLEPEEEKFLEFVLSELKMQYLEKTETVKL